VAGVLRVVAVVVEIEVDEAEQVAKFVRGDGLLKTTGRRERR